MEQQVIDVRELAFSHSKKDTLFDGLNLKLAGGNIYGLLGVNGAGKTTLLKILSGLLFPQNGNCDLLGLPSHNRSADVLSQIVYVPEELYTPALTIREYHAVYAPFYPSFDYDEFFGYLNQFDLSESQALAGLSYGQRKKFFISFALACNTKLLYFDEPTNGLDIPSKSLLRKLLVSAVHPERVIIISTHQVRDIQNLIDPILILDAGEVIFQESVASINSKLGMTLSPVEPEAGSYVFYESSIGGYAVLYEEKGAGANVDLELLFKAVLADPAGLGTVFSGVGR